MSPQIFANGIREIILKLPSNIIIFIVVCSYVVVWSCKKLIFPLPNVHVTYTTFHDFSAIGLLHQVSAIVSISVLLVSLFALLYAGRLVFFSKKVLRNRFTRWRRAIGRPAHKS